MAWANGTTNVQAGKMCITKAALCWAMFTLVCAAEERPFHNPAGDTQLSTDPWAEVVSEKMEYDVQFNETMRLLEKDSRDFKKHKDKVFHPHGTPLRRHQQDQPRSRCKKTYLRSIGGGCGLCESQGGHCVFAHHSAHRVHVFCFDRRSRRAWSNDVQKGQRIQQNDSRVRRSG